MPFTPKTQAYNAKINSIVLGTGGKAAQIGGNNVLPFYSFDAPIENAPKIGVEITDEALEEYVQPKLKAFYDGCGTLAEMAVRAQDIQGVSFLALHLKGADPNGRNRSVEECVALAESIADAVELPLVIMGCKDIEKDAELFAKISEKLSGKNILVLSAREENYKTVGASAALAYGQKVGAESAVDINLAKQLNTVMGSAAAGYGFEYLASTLERIKLAALGQGDAQLQMPIMTPVSPETWGVKEAIMPEAEMPEWGDAEERGIGMETATASACLAAGSDAIIMRHPDAIQAIARMIDELV